MGVKRTGRCVALGGVASVLQRIHAQEIGDILEAYLSRPTASVMPSWAASWLCCVPDVMNPLEDDEAASRLSGNFLTGSIAEAGSTGQAKQGS